MQGKWEHLGDFSFHSASKVYAGLEQRARALDAAQRTKGVPVLTVKVTAQHWGPMDTVASLLSDERELAKLRHEYAITFYRQGGGEFVFQCKEDYQQGLLKEVNASSTYKISHKAQGLEPLACTGCTVPMISRGFLQGNSPSPSVRDGPWTSSRSKLRGRLIATMTTAPQPNP